MRAAAEHVLARGPQAWDRCCGTIGDAYTMLALSRIDRERDWAAEATTLATHALVSPAQSSWAFGLFKRESGLVCLCLDLLAGTTRFPLLEA